MQHLFWRFYFKHPRSTAVYVLPGLYFFAFNTNWRILPIAKPHKYNPTHEDGIRWPNWLRTLLFNRSPDFTVGKKSDPYLHRWWMLPRNPVSNWYLHHFMRSDDDRALHDHRYFNISIILKGSYIEEVPDFSKAPSPYTRIADLPRKRILRKAWRPIVRWSGADSHRIELIDDKPVWTLFITGPMRRLWGFHCKQGWIPYQQFVGKDPGSVGRGCGETQPRVGIDTGAAEGDRSVGATFENGRVTGTFREPSREE